MRDSLRRMRGGGVEPTQVGLIEPMAIFANWDLWREMLRVLTGICNIRRQKIPHARDPSEGRQTCFSQSKSF